MNRQSCISPLLLPAALIILSAAVFPCVHALSLGQSEPRAEQTPDPNTTKHNARPGESTPNAPPANDPKLPSEPAAYSYEFSQPAFYIRHIFIEHDGNGQGRVTFERLNEETPVVEPIQLSPTVLNRVTALWQALRFLDSQEDYQSDRQFPHLGTMRITMSQGTRKRTAQFNWSHNASAAALVSEYRRVADQAVFIFDVSVARENQPLNAPKLMEQMESMLKRNWLSDPQQLIPLLKEISIDEHVPLIARNHALRLLKKIEK
ncbi:MAG: hypothetical protein ACREBG_04275 [Pyrinomonadaceae bacterium]